MTALLGGESSRSSYTVTQTVSKSVSCLNVLVCKCGLEGGGKQSVNTRLLGAELAPKCVGWFRVCGAGMWWKFGNFAQVSDSLGKMTKKANFFMEMIMKNTSKKL